MGLGAMRIAKRLAEERIPSGEARNRDAVEADAVGVLAHAMEHAGDDRAQFVAEHLDQVLRRPPALDLEQRLGAAVAVDQLTLVIDEEARRHEALEQAVVDGEQLRADRGGPAGGSERPGAAGTGQRQLQVGRQADVAPLLEDLGVLVDRLELVEQAAGALARSQKQVAAGLQREMEQREDGLLRVRLEVDQQVAAGDQIELRERRVANQVVRREDDALADVLRDVIAVRLEREVALEALRADAGQLLLAVDAGAGDFERRLVHVGRENLDVRILPARHHLFVQQDGDRVGLLAGGAARHPDPDLIVAGIAPGPLDDLGDDFLLEDLERLVVAKESGDADQQIFVQRVELARVGAAAARRSCRDRAPGSTPAGARCVA